MFIENPDAFKSWLTSILEPLCDADPAALAKYVYALVKKDKTLEELRDGMVDQLDVFLQHETKPFVDMLFKSLESLEYLKMAEKPSSPPQPAEDPEPETGRRNSATGRRDSANSATGRRDSANSVTGRRDSAHTGEDSEPREQAMNGEPEENLNNNNNCRNASPPAPVKHRVVVRSRPPNEQTLVKVLPLNELLEEPVEPQRRRDRRDMPRDIDRRRRRSREWGGRMRARRTHREPEHERPRRSRSPRYRNRSPSLEAPGTRSRSRSPVPPAMRDHERERDRLRAPREMERDRMSRDRDHRDKLSRERDRNRSRDRSRDRSMSPPEPHIKRRCRDFDEKGYCMRGDLCQWDHGADPVVLEDTALTRLIPQPPVPTEYNPLTPDIWCGSGFPPYPHHPHHPPLPHPHPPRELIPIPRIRHEGPPMPGPPMMAMPRHPPPPRKHFDYNRLARPPLPAHAANCSLEVKKVPRGLNDITHLNNHFSKFGKIVNIQVCFEGDPEGALITFSSPTEANVAHKSTEAVLNNRFIKVFWHNPENKQENTAPGSQPNKPVNNGQPPNPHMSHNKVLINRDNIKATADIKQQQIDKDKQAKELTNGLTPAEPKKDAPAAPKQPIEKSKQVMEMHKRAQALLETQLQQQVLLIQRLESGNVTGAQKTALMEAINSAQEGIEKLRKELVQYNKTMRQMQAKRPKTREEWQKEILDAELDMFTKQQEGQDVTELAKRIADLRRQMTTIFPVYSAARRPHPSFASTRARYNTATRFTRGAAAAKTFASNSVDHRPKALLISGFETDELDSLVTHFSQFGEVTGKEVNLAVPELVLQYKARAQAEQALLRGKNYNDRTLSITWVTNNKPIGASTGPATPNGETNENVKEPESVLENREDTLLRFDEDDEEEAEDRSWRR